MPHHKQFATLTYRFGVLTFELSQRIIFMSPGHRDDREEKMNESQEMNRSQVQDHKERFKIIVNARPKEVTDDEQSFNQIVALAFNPVPSGPNIVFTVSYRKGPKENPEGTMAPGQTVEVKDGMVFDVTATDKS